MAFLGIRGRFEARFHCKEDIKECAFSVNVVFEGDIVHGFVDGIDDSVARRALTNALAKLDGHFLNDIVGRATKENVAEYILYQLRELNVHSLTLHEGDVFVKVMGVDLNPATFMVRHKFNRGNDLLRRGKLREAIKEFDSVIEDDPGFAMAFNMRGRCWKYLEEHEGARDDYIRAIRFAPEYGEAYRNLGNAYLELGGHTKTLKMFDRAVELMPRSSLARNNRGFALQSLERFQEAIEDHSGAIRLDPNYAEAYRDRAKAYAAIGEDELARADMERASELVRNELDTYASKKYY